MNMKATPVHPAAIAGRLASQHEHHPQNGQPAKQGHFAGAIFRLPRTPPGPRPQPRSAAAHRQRPRPPASGQNDGAQDIDAAGAGGAQASMATDATDDKEPRSVVTTDTHSGDDNSDASAGRSGRRAHFRLRSRPDNRKPAPLAGDWMDKSDWPGFALLRAAAGQDGGSRPSDTECAEALVKALLASLSIDPRGAAPAIPVQAICSAVVCAYLRSGSQRGALATLGHVKTLLMAQRPAQARTPSPPLGEPLQNRHLLLPLVLLHADRVRTQAQRNNACDRLELLQRQPVGLPPR